MVTSTIYFDSSGVTMVPLLAGGEFSLVARRKLDMHGCQYIRSQMIGDASSTSVKYSIQGSSDGGSTWTDLITDADTPQNTDGLAVTDWTSFSSSLADDLLVRVMLKGNSLATLQVKVIDVQVR